MRDNVDLLRAMLLPGESTHDLTDRDRKLLLESYRVGYADGYLAAVNDLRTKLHSIADDWIALVP